MQRKNLYTDIRQCTGCRSCEVACRQENNLPPDYNWINVIQVKPRESKGNSKPAYVPIFCHNCDRAPCVSACPKKAITRMSDGNVLINPGLCIGCMSCAEVCPFGAIAFDPRQRVATLCTLCRQLTEERKEPACVRACPSECLYYDNFNSVMDKIQEQASQRRGE